MKLKKSTLGLIIILLLYTVLSFYKLGNTKNPQTYVNLKNGDTLVYKIESNAGLSYAMVYDGYCESYVSFYVTNDYNDRASYKRLGNFEIDYANIFKWNRLYFDQEYSAYNYLIIESYWDTTYIGEMKIYNQNGNEIPITAVNENAKVLIDEQDIVPEEYSYMNSSYFDEIYFPRAAYEIMNKLPLFEYVHPPLGKLIMSIPMYFLGVNPFAYRLMGNIAGILMILVIYCISKELFKKPKYALFAAGIMALDGMHFVQTRIGTVDSFLVLFCLSSFLFFIKYLKLPKEEEFKKKAILLLISGTFWGMAMSVKWTASFVGLGMGIVYFIDHIKNKKLSIKLLLVSILSFVIIPIIIYVVSYIPVMADQNENITDIKTFFEYQKKMYKYHSELKAEHPFTSKWYTWPILQKPMWYYVSYHDSGKYGTISCMGNPAIWWLSIITAIFTFIYSVIKKDKEGLILILMIACTWLPYAFIGRIMFIYHYFITLPFMMLTIVFAFNKIIEWKEKFTFLIPVFLLIFLGMFIYFYPVYSGMPVKIEYIENTKWFSSWIY